MVEMFKPMGAKYSVQRRVRGYHDIRMDGISDLVLRSRGPSVFDIGCNRGAGRLRVRRQRGHQGPRLRHLRAGHQDGPGVFADLRSVESRFEVCDLTRGPAALKRFEGQSYDITLCLATYHKLKRVMPPADLSELMQHFGRWTRATSPGAAPRTSRRENDRRSRRWTRTWRGRPRRIHTSYISAELGVAAIWAQGIMSRPIPHRRRPGRGGDRRSLLRPAAREGVTSYLEVGSKFGGSLWRVGQRAAEGARASSRSTCRAGPRPGRRARPR
jgi:hypothetical protein